MSECAANLTRREIAELLHEVDVLREAVRTLREAMCPELALPHGWGLAPLERKFVLALRSVSTRVPTRNAALAALYGVTGRDWPDHRVLDVITFKARSKLRRFGVTIATVREVGWRLEPLSLARIEAAIQRENAALRVAA